MSIKLGNIMILGLRSFGVDFERIGYDSNGKKTIYFSVPKSSDSLDVNGNQLAGDLLAKKVKKQFADCNIKDYIFKYKIRDEHWDQFKTNAFKNGPMKNLYMSDDYEKILFG